MSTSATIENQEAPPDSLHSVVGGRSCKMEMHAMSIFWYSVGVWQRFKTMSREDQKRAGQTASDALACDAALAVADGKVNIPGFGEVSGHKAAAIMSCYIVTGAATEHLDSPFLRAAREAKKAAELLEPNLTVPLALKPHTANGGIESETTRPGGAETADLGRRDESSNDPSSATTPSKP